jgi:hypothetical protein
VAGLSAVLALSACSVAAEGPEPEPAAELRTTDVSSVRVGGQRELDAAYWLGLSTDGKTVLSNSRDGTCVRGVDGGHEHCLGEGMFDVGSAAWSPDGRALAITDHHGLGLEPDVWVLDVESGDLTDLTDDGIESEGISLVDPTMPEGAAVDVFPSWSADGEQIRFLRKESADAVGVWSVSPSGGAPARLGVIDTSWEEVRTVAWADDAVAWVSGPLDGANREVLVSELAGGEPRTLLSGEYSTLSFSVDGDFLLADQSGVDGAPAVGEALVVPTGGGDPVPVADGAVTYPAWGPEGHVIAYVESPGTLRVVGKPGETPRDLHQRPDIRAADLDSIDWVPGSMLVSLGAEHPVVLDVDGP